MTRGDLAARSSIHASQVKCNFRRLVRYEQRLLPKRLLKVFLQHLTKHSHCILYIRLWFRVKGKLSLSNIFYLVI